MLDLITMKTRLALLRNGLEKLSITNPFIVIVTVLFCLSLCAVFPSIDRTYDLPQMVAFWFLGAAIWLRESKRQFNKESWLAIFAVLFLSLLLTKFVTIHESFVLLGLVATLAFLLSTLSSQERELLKRCVILVSILQTTLVFGSLLTTDHSQLGFRQLNNVPVGTIGNPDFLATTIAAGILFLLGTTLTKPFKVVAIVFLLAGLVLTRSRGTVALLCILIAWDHLPRRLVGYGIISLAIAVVTFWERFSGRVQLWWTSIVAYFDSPLLGHGIGSFDSVYFNTNLRIMSADESFRQTFGPWSSLVADAHNIILHWAVELGIFGVAASVAVLALLILRLRELAPDDRRVVVILWVKSLYTVVLISIQSLSLLALSLGSKPDDEPSTPRRRSLYLSLFALAMVAYPIFQFAMISGDLHQSLKYVTNGLPRKALLYADNVLKRDSENTDALLLMSYSYLKLDQCSHSSAYALRAARIRQNMDVYKRASHILFDCEFYQEALGLLNDLHIVFPEHRTTTMKMAWAYYYSGNSSEAVKLARSVLASRPRRVSRSDEKNLSEAADLLRQLSQN